MFKIPIAKTKQDRQPDLIVATIHHSIGMMRVEATGKRAIAFLRMFMNPGKLLLLHPCNNGGFWCRHYEDDREPLIAAARLAGLTINSVPDNESFWSAIPDDDDEAADA